MADPEETIIYGKVTRRGVYDNAFSGASVSATAVYPDGTEDVETDWILTRLPRARNFRTIFPDAKFRIVFPERLPEGTTVCLKFAPGSEKTLPPHCPEGMM